MADVIRIVCPPLLVAWNGTARKAFPAGAWRSAAHISKGRGLLELRGITAGAIVALGFQGATAENVVTDFANDTDMLIGDKTTEDLYYPGGVVTVSTQLATKQLVRPCWYVKSPTQGTLVTAWVGGWIELIMG